MRNIHNIYLILSKAPHICNQSIAFSLLETADLPPERLLKKDSGKPFFEQASLSGWDVSFSHSDDLYAGVLGQNLLIGIDCEYHKPIDLKPSLLGLVMNPTEEKRMGGSSCPTKFFYEVWTMKEAISKSLGIGLNLDFTTFDCERPEKELRTAGYFQKMEHLYCKRFSQLDNTSVSFSSISKNRTEYRFISCPGSLL